MAPVWRGIKMARNTDLGWVQAGDALKPVLERLAASRGMTPEQFRDECATGDVPDAQDATGASRQSTVTAGLRGRFGGKVTLAHS